MEHFKDKSRLYDTYQVDHAFNYLPTFIFSF